MPEFKETSAPERRAPSTNLTRGTLRGLTADLLGSPVDLATNVTNLGVAGTGYLAHKLGLTDTPPDLIEGKNVPFSSDWLAKNTPLEEKEGEGKGYHEGRTAANIISMLLRGTGRMPTRETPPTTGGPTSQAGALYLNKQGKPMGEDLAMYHTTQGIMGTPGHPKYGTPLQELTNPSFAITSNKGVPDTMNAFGPNIIVPNPRGLDPRTSNTSLKAHDFYTPRKDDSMEALIRSMEDEVGMKSPDALARARLEDRFRSRYAKGGTGGESGSEKGMVDTSAATMSMNTTPRFRSFQHFDENPKGAERLRKLDLPGSMFRTRYENLTEQDWKAVQQAKGIDPLNKGEEIANALQSKALNPKYWSSEPLSAKDIRMYGGKVTDPRYNDPEFVKAVTERLRAYKKENIDYTPSDYGELKKFGPWGINKGNVLAYIAGRDNEFETASKALGNKGIPVYKRGSFADDKDIHEAIAEMQTYALRRKGR